MSYSDCRDQTTQWSHVPLFPRTTQSVFCSAGTDKREKKEPKRLNLQLILLIISENWDSDVDVTGLRWTGVIRMLPRWCLCLVTTTHASNQSKLSCRLLPNRFCTSWNQWKILRISVSRFQVVGYFARLYTCSNSILTTNQSDTIY